MCLVSIYSALSSLFERNTHKQMDFTTKALPRSGHYTIRIELKFEARFGILLSRLFSITSAKTIRILVAPLLLLQLDASQNTTFVCNMSNKCP